MPKQLDKFTATWVSHSSITDFLQCPRAYYLKNVYKEPDSGRKIQVITPPLALGSTVHAVLESLSQLPTAERFKTPLVKRFDEAWVGVTGKKGGFFSQSQEQKYRSAGERMLQYVTRHPDLLARPAVKLSSKIPFFWLSSEDEIILCGKLDWLEYLPDSDSVHIVDFKTGKSQESADSLQLPIYLLLAHHVQKRSVARLSYWYLRHKQAPVAQPLPDLEESRQKVLEIAKKIKLARKLGHFVCSKKTGCRACRDLEKVVAGEGELVGVGDYNQSIYILPDTDPQNGQVDQDDRIL